MAKKGFQYYSVETDRYRDKKIRKLKRDCGCNGLAVYDFLLCEIYRVEGYFLEWDDSTAFDVADYFGLKETQVNEYVTYCCSVGLFNRELYTSERILTSLAIQSRFIDWSKKAKRANIEILEKHKIIPEKTSIIPEEIVIVQEHLEQSKVKESKEEEREVLRPPEENTELPANSNSPPPVPPPPSHNTMNGGLFPGENEIDMELPEMKVGVQIQRIRYTMKVDIDQQQVLGMWEVFKAEHFTGKKYYKNTEDVYAHFGNWLKDQKFSNGSARKQTTSGSINAVNSAFSDLQRNLDASVRNGREDEGH